MKDSRIVFPAVASSLMLLLAAILKWPYSFYVLLRMVVSLSAIYSAMKAYATGRQLWVWVMAAVAVVFNPILPLHMARTEWRNFNILGVGIFVAWIFAERLAGRNRNAS